MPDQTPITRFENIENKDMQSITVTLQDGDAASANRYDTFFIVSRPIEVMEIRAVWSAASTSGLLNVANLTGTQSSTSGVEIINSTSPFTAIDMSGTANTVNIRQSQQLVNRQLATGDRLALSSAGTLTSQDNLVVTVLYKPIGKGDYR